MIFNLASQQQFVMNVGGGDKINFGSNINLIKSVPVLQRRNQTRPLLLVTTLALLRPGSKYDKMLCCVLSIFYILHSISISTLYFRNSRMFVKI